MILSQQRSGSTHNQNRKDARFATFLAAYACRSRMKEKHMKQIVRLMCLGIVLVVGPVACNDAVQDQARSTSNLKGPAPEARPAAAQAQEFSGLPTVPIPADVRYTVISTNVIPGIKRSLDVRLSRKVEEDVLRAIAMNLKKDDPKRHERTFIVYYLPEMKVGAGGWATTHFNPDLEVNILGLTLKQEIAFAKKVEDTTREVVGNWLDQSPMVGGKISIYRKDGKIYMEREFKDGSSSNEEMVEKPSSSGTRYEEKGGSNFGEYYILDRQGNLQIRDREGLIATTRKIE